MQLQQGQNKKKRQAENNRPETGFVTWRGTQELRGCLRTGDGGARGIWPFPRKNGPTGREHLVDLKRRSKAREIVQ